MAEKPENITISKKEAEFIQDTLYLTFSMPEIRRTPDISACVEKSLAYLEDALNS